MNPALDPGVITSGTVVPAAEVTVKGLVPTLTATGLLAILTFCTNTQTAVELNDESN
jgi:hypothetical protein